MTVGPFGFETPWAIAPAALLPVYVWWRLRSLRLTALAFAPLQYRPERGVAVLAPILLVVAECLMLACGLIALTAPYTESKRESIREDGLDIALVLDVSASMMAADFKPNRLEVLKRFAGDFVKRSAGDRIAVYIFAKDVFTQTPMTTDHPVLLDLLKGITYHIIDHAKSGGTAMGDAMLAAGEALARNKIRGRDQVMLLFTDGESNYGVDPALAARFLRGNDIRFYVVGIGGEQAVQVFIDGKPFIAVGNRPLFTKLDDAALKSVTEAGGGRYYRAKNETVLGEIFSELSRLERTPLEVRTQRIRRHHTSLLALAGAVLFLGWAVLFGFYLRRPWL